MNEQRLESLAREVYEAAYPEMDSKNHWRTVGSEILDWLRDGDTAHIEATTVAELADEWLVYDSAEVDEE